MDACSIVWTSPKRMQSKSRYFHFLAFILIYLMFKVSEVSYPIIFQSCEIVAELGAERRIEKFTRNICFITNYSTNLCNTIKLIFCALYTQKYIKQVVIIAHSISMSYPNPINFRRHKQILFPSFFVFLFSSLQ